ncbi:multidrug resistance-associated protein [Aspergillus tamarii]|uniref:Multidrug resistance-associated protein n=1 Tax=Aspergillus tamarii TaxID=41984 RepID=A0A5N6UAI9_ASPTM|nr:multidrug resistance-associated protein [Aspergillus tamarii]
MISECHGPLWAIDDLSRCFQRNYLQVIFPLTTCGLSLLLIVLSLVYRYVVARKSMSYRIVHDDATTDDAQGVEVVEEEQEEETDPMLSKAAQAELLQFDVDSPRHQITSIALELGASAGEVAVFIAILLTNGWGDLGKLPALVKLVVWSYILFLVLIRFLLSTLGLHSFLRLWNYTAALYGLQWLFTVFVFRSAVIHPISRRAMYFSAAEFSLSTFLLLIAMTTRRGSKPVLVPREDALEPSRQPTASLLSRFTFSWLDPLVYKGCIQTLELRDVWNLTKSQQAATILGGFRCKQYKGTLTWKLLRYFAGTLLVQGAWTMLSSCFMYLPTVILGAIIQYVEDPRSITANAAWLYATLLFCSGAIQGIADGQALFIGRKLGVKLRAIIIGEIYAKALRRRAVTSVDSTQKKAEDSPTDNKKNGVFSFGRKVAATDPETGPDDAKSEAEDPTHQANVGTIINLMAIDSFKVSELGANLPFLWASVPVQIIIAVSLLYRLLGFSSFAGIIIMVSLLPINTIIAKQFTKIQDRILKGTDARIHATNEVLQNIRIIKYFAWEQRFQDAVDEKRKVELKALRFRYILWSVIAIIFFGTPILITFSSFFLYTVVEKKHLTPSVAFPALSLFALLRTPLDQLADILAHVQESRVSLERVDKYLKEEETDKYVQLEPDGTGEQPSRIALDNATLTWGSIKGQYQDETPNKSSDAFRLIDLNVTFHVGGLNIIAGPTGSGKTSLLMALLGEMKLLKGRVRLPGGTVSRAELPVDPQTGLMESVAYCAQETWLVNDTVKENIVFASPFDQKRYNAVIEACALDRDLAILDAGDQTMVGENGVSLSGGQKQRISLARAIYSRARHILLDDCLSAVDSHAAKHIFREALTGTLMRDRTCILVTHNVALTVPHAHYVIVLQNGKIAAQGHPDEVAASGAFGGGLLKSRPASKSDSQRQYCRHTGRGEHHEGSHIARRSAVNSSTDKGIKREDACPRLVESKAVGSIRWSTIKMYLKSMGSWYYWASALLVFSLQQLGSVSANIWIRHWANSYRTEAAMTNLEHPSSNVGVPLTSALGSPHISTQTTTSTSADVNVSYYLGVYALLGALYVLISFTREAVLFWGSLHASMKIHKRLLKAVMHAKFRFFDSTPLGQLMNRFSKDIETVDQEIVPAAIGMLHFLAKVIVIVVLISVTTPWFLVAAVFITLIYFTLGAVYLNTSRDLKRLESVQRSPLYQQFGETLNGIVTIRAYGDGPRFIVDNHRRINNYNRPHLYFWAINRWLALRIDIVGASVSFLAAVFIITNIGKVDAGAAGLSLTYAVTFSENVLWLVRLYSEVQHNMNSVERVNEYLGVEQEAMAVIPDSRPPAPWPSHGEVEFSSYTTRYRADLDPVLRDVSFTVRAGEKVGIVGRTGAGKSSLALALLRGLEAEKGRIYIDSIDISAIGLKDLRESIAIVPQDPTLFSGTIRSNLDPFGMFTDEQIFTALRYVHLIGFRASEIITPMTGGEYLEPSTSILNGANAATQDNKNIFLNLENPVAESGSNLSQGQRQLLCLARVLLKNPKVLVMDEATASIDYSTDSKIQEMLRELRDSTIITIAHRLQTIIDYDKVLVLDHGRVVEFDHPWTLINNTDGLFRSLCEDSGNMEVLQNGAKQVWEQKCLVDAS